MAEQVKLEAEVYGQEAKSAGKKELESSIFGVEPNLGLLHQVVRWQRAKKRAGTHKTQTRSEVTATGTKPWKQKGTGRARAGSYRSPVWIGGGVAHGPKPRSYEFKLNKKEKVLALKSALSARQAEGAISVVSDFGIQEPKTAIAKKYLENLGVTAKDKVLLVIEREDLNLLKSFRNIERINIVSIEGLNVYDILAANKLVIKESCLSQLKA